MICYVPQNISKKESLESGLIDKPFVHKLLHASQVFNYVIREGVRIADETGAVASTIARYQQTEFLVTLHTLGNGTFKRFQQTTKKLP